MTSIENFNSLLFNQKWRKLNELYDSSDKTLVGLYNNEIIGVCLTNTIIGMITSSNVLMTLIENKDNCKSFDVCTFMENIYRCLKHPTPVRMGYVKETPGDILRAGIVSVAKNVPYKSKFGVCGDYYLFKTFFNDLNLWSLGREDDAEKCERLILRSKEIDSVEAIRWHIILTDLFDIFDDRTLIFQERNQWSYIYYQQFNMLNLHFSIRNFSYHRFNNVRPFLINNHVDFKIEDLCENLSSRKIYPNVIQMSVGESSIFELHSITLEDITTNLISSFSDVGCCGKLSLSDFPVTMVRRHHTIPLLNNNEPFLIEFPIDKMNITYKLKAISIALEEEHRMMYSELKPISGIIVRQDPLCIDIIFEKIMQIMETVELKKHLHQKFWES
ncbi:hypothetical protein SNEBB_004996 [Seison nebaliae]|nr:hypothetical protein SNEBB_004996 [Seison nebaliae]